MRTPGVSRWGTRGVAVRPRRWLPAVPLAVLVVGVGVAMAAPSRSTTASDTVIGGLPAADLTGVQLRGAITRALAASPATVVVRLGEKTVRVPTADLGVTVDVEATVRSALAVPAPLWRAVLPGQGSAVRPAAVDVDERRLAAIVARLVTEAAVSPSYGDLLWSSGAFAPVAPRGGQDADPNAVRQALLAAAAALPTPERVEVPVRQRPARVDAAAVSALAAALSGALPPQVSLAAGPLTAEVPVTVLGPLVTVSAASPAEGRPPAAVPALRAVPAAQLASKLAAQLTRAAVLPRLAAAAPMPTLTAQGDASWRAAPATVALRTPARAGQRVAPADVLRALESAVQGAVDMRGLPDPVPVPRQIVEPAVSDAQARRVNAVVGTFTTTFPCCQPRVANIRRIARTVSGTLVPAGATFSLNGLVGPRTVAKGYVDAPYIRDGELATDVGGGVSQFATTLLNAAFFAGVHLERRQPHSFYISRYPPGREATIDYPGIDLQFVNDLATPLLIDARVTATTLTVSLLGRSDGRTVTAKASPRRRLPGKDFAITITRIVAVPAQPQRVERYSATYNRPPAGD